MSVIAITYPLALPTTPAPTDTDINLEYAIASAASPYSFARQTQDRLGRRWRARVTLALMKRPEADIWLVFFSLLHGIRGTFLMGDWDRRQPRGTIAGAPAVAGAGQTGNGLAIDGCTPGTTWLKGSHTQIENRLYRLVADFTASGGGAGTLQLEPNLRAAPADNALLTYLAPKGLFALTQNYVPSPSDLVGVHRFSFEAIEAL